MYMYSHPEFTLAKPNVFPGTIKITTASNYHTQKFLFQHMYIQDRTCTYSTCTCTYRTGHVHTGHVHVHTGHVHCIMYMYTAESYK